MPDGSLASCRKQGDLLLCSAFNCAQCVHIMANSLTAMDDLTACSWKKTLPPSSGHTVLISLLFIPKSCCPVSTPRLLTVLCKKRDKTESNSCNTTYSECKHKPVCDSVENITHILEKPLYSSQACTSAGEEDMCRVTGPRDSRCKGNRGE